MVNWVGLVLSVTVSMTIYCGFDCFFTDDYDFPFAVVFFPSTNSSIASICLRFASSSDASDALMVSVLTRCKVAVTGTSSFVMRFFYDDTFILALAEALFLD
jgi:hypothetical protein